MNRFVNLWLIALIILCPLMAQFDPTGGDLTPAREHEPLKPLSSINQPARILWDTSHGVLLDYVPTGRYSELTSLLAAKGRMVEASDAGILNLNLSQYTTLVVSLASSWDSPYSDAEADRVFDWVQNGGHLLIMSDNDLTPNENLATVASRFGVTITDIPLFPALLYIEHFSSHPVVGGLSQLLFAASGDHLISPPMEAAAWDDTGRIIVSVGQFGAGHVVVVGDINCMSNDLLSASDNQLFAENVFDALTVATVPTLSTPYLFLLLIGLVGSALVVLRYRRRDNDPNGGRFFCLRRSGGDQLGGQAFTGVVKVSSSAEASCAR